MPDQLSPIPPFLFLTEHQRRALATLFYSQNSAAKALVEQIIFEPVNPSGPHTLVEVVQQGLKKSLQQIQEAAPPVPPPKSDIAHNRSKKQSPKAQSIPDPIKTKEEIAAGLGFTNMDMLRLLKLHDILKLLNISKSTWYRGMASGKYPQPVRISAKAVGWKLIDLIDLISK